MSANINNFYFFPKDGNFVALFTDKKLNQMALLAIKVADFCTKPTNMTKKNIY